MTITTPAVVTLLRQCLQKPARGVLILLYLAGFYTHVTLYVAGGMKVPVVLCGGTAILMCMRNTKRMRVSHLKWMLAVLSIAGCSAVLRSDAMPFFTSRASGLLYFAYSLFCSYGLFLELQRWERKRAQALFAVMVQCLLVGAVLESLGILRGPSDAFRAAVFDESTIYDNEARDMELFGIVRPMLFTSEPSHLAKAYLVALVAMLILSTRRKRYLEFFGFAAAGLFVIRSPVILLAAPLGALVFVYVDVGGIRSMLSLLRARRGLRLAVLGFAGTLLVASTVTSLFSVRFENVRAGRDDSFTMRVIGPAAIAWRVATAHPIWGAGISGKEAMAPAIAETYAAIGLVHPERLDAIGVDSSVNSFWLHWTYFGFVGGILVALAIHGWLSSLVRSSGVFVLLALCVLANSMGAYNGVRLWTMGAILAACTALASEPQVEHDETEGGIIS